MAIIAILAGMLLPALGKAKERARRIQCLNQLRQISTAVLLYADDNGERTPVNDAGHWPWDISVSADAAFVSKYGVSRAVAYCPSRPSDWEPVATSWDFGTPSRGYRITGYSYFWEGSPYLLPALMQTTVQGTAGKSPATSELACDAIINVNGVYARVPSYNPHSGSSHLQGGRPTGANRAYLDGHVEWRRHERIVINQPDGGMRPPFEY